MDINAAAADDDDDDDDDEFYGNGLSIKKESRSDTADQWKSLSKDAGGRVQWPMDMIDDGFETDEIMEAKAMTA